MVFMYVLNQTSNYAKLDIQLLNIEVKIDTFSKYHTWSLSPLGKAKDYQRNSLIKYALLNISL